MCTCTSTRKSELGQVPEFLLVLELESGPVFVIESEVALRMGL